MRKVKIEELKNLNSSKTYFIEFTTTWCADCKMMKPVIDNLEAWASDEKMNVEFLEIDAEESNQYQDDNAEWKTLKVPSFFVVKNGKKEHIGYEYLPIEKFQSVLNR